MENFETRQVENLDSIKVDIVWYDKKLEWLNKLGLKWLESLDMKPYDKLKGYNDKLWNDILQMHNKLLDLLMSKDGKENKEWLLNDIDNYKKQSEYDLAIKDLINDYETKQDSKKIESDLSTIAISNQAIKTSIRFGNFAWMEGSKTDLSAIQ